MNESLSKLPSPEVSVIIPAYNLEGYLDTCLQSVLAQTLGNFEAIVVDDGSTDGTPGLLRRYAERDPRIIVVSTPNRGVARARETGIARAQGKYIAFLDGDDFWEPRMLEEMTASIGQNGGYDIVCCNFKRVCKTYEAIYRESRTEDMEGLEFLEATLRHSIWVTLWGKLYRRELFDNGLNHHPLRLGEDSLLNIQIGCQQPRVRFVDYVGSGYVQRGGSANRSPLDIGYCVKFSEAVHAELVRHRDVVGDRLEFYLLLNKMRWYLVYLRKSHNPWAGDTEFARGINAEAERYRAELEGFFSRCDWLLLRMDRRRWMRPGVLAVSTLMRWGKSLKRRLTR